MTLTDGEKTFVVRGERRDRDRKTARKLDASVLNMAALMQDRHVKPTYSIPKSFSTDSY